MMESTTGYHQQRRRHYRLSPSFDSTTSIRNQQMLSTLTHPYTPCESLTETTEENDSLKFELDHEGELSDDASCLSSISNFDEETLNDHSVYALHVFIATVEGQVSVMRGDKLMLLDDTNAYWWLVKIMKTSDIGYIPAENIETPLERLARFNKIRNSEIISVPSSEIKRKRLKSLSGKKVSMAKNVTIQSMIITADEDSNFHFTETFEETRASIEDPNSLDEEQRNENCLPTRLSDHALSVGLTQHFIQYQSSRPPSTTDLTSHSTTSNTKHPVKNLRHLLSGSNKAHSSAESLSNNSSPTLHHPPNEKLSVLRVFPGNINVKATFNSVLVNENTTAEQLLAFALKRFRLLDSHDELCDGIEYYISVKVLDHDEITLSAHDKPLAMFYSLNTLLTTPMPSLTHIRSKVQLTRIGVTQSTTSNNTSFGENSVIRFLLNKRIKRINEQDGQLRIKIAYYTDASTRAKPSTNSTTSRLSQLYRRSNSHQLRLGRLSSSSTFSLSSSSPPKQLLDRIEKLVSVPSQLLVSDLTSLALEKFHIQRGVPYTFANDKLDRYGMTLVLQGKEHVLNANRTIIDILNDEWLNPKGKDDDGILFVLRKMQSRLRSPPPSPLYAGTITPTVHSPSPPSPTDTMPTNHDLCNSSLSLASSSSSSASSSSPPSLATPDSTASMTYNNTNDNNSSPQQQHAKLSTDVLLHRIDMTLSSLEKNLMVASGSFFKTSSTNSTYTYR